jgi:hypothetical protein
MYDFSLLLDQLRTEILTEGLSDDEIVTHMSKEAGIAPNDPSTKRAPKKFTWAISVLKDLYIKNFYSKGTIWLKDPKAKTAGVIFLASKNCILFHYNESFIEPFDQKNIFFLLGHEFYHILQHHTTNWSDISKNDPAAKRFPHLAHELANIAMDVWINTYLYKKGHFAGHSIEPPIECCGFRLPGKWGNTEKWLLEQAEKALKRKLTSVEAKDFEYNGAHEWKPFYYWIVSLFDKYDLWPNKPGGGDDSPPQMPKPGDIIVSRQGSKFGIVVSCDNQGNVTKVRSLSKEDAFTLLNELGKNAPVKIY